MSAFEEMLEADLGPLTEDFDGRTLRSQLDSWVVLVRAGKPFPAAQYRKAEGMCPLGGGHWTEHCYSHPVPPSPEGGTDG